MTCGRRWGGISFKFDAEAFAFDANAPLPVLNDDGSGWTLSFGPALEPIRVNFVPKPASIHYERGDRREIRVSFNRPEERIGTKEVTMTVTLPKDGAIVPSTAERLAPPDPATWFDYLQSASSFPVDLSFLNASEKPAGKRGYVRANGSSLEFSDGTPARFWGTNLTASTLFQTSPQYARLHARRLSQLGFDIC